ncbi:hypothetical protein C4D60_Mb07t07440 [Musa balbisiana]|uniref:Uncharacterized protein n=1 Tax=Musa balbisiana TaxID=52838 RepID=A0A4S8JDT8_MUSBA|nr:hypothetical protein C4D60_Mb07t07440 [Musa balbisiana]
MKGEANSNALGRVDSELGRVDPSRPVIENVATRPKRHQPVRDGATDLVRRIEPQGGRGLVVAFLPLNRPQCPPCHLPPGPSSAALRRHPRQLLLRSRRLRQAPEP